MTDGQRDRVGIEYSRKLDMIYKFTEGNRSIAILGTKTKNVREKRVKTKINLITIYNNFTNLTIYNRLTNSQRYFIYILRDVVRKKLGKLGKVSKQGGGCVNLIHLCFVSMSLTLTHN